MKAKPLYAVAPRRDFGQWTIYFEKTARIVGSHITGYGFDNFLKYYKGLPYFPIFITGEGNFGKMAGFILRNNNRDVNGETMDNDLSNEEYLNGLIEAGAKQVAINKDETMLIE